MILKFFYIMSNALKMPLNILAFELQFVVVLVFKPSFAARNANGGVKAVAKWIFLHVRPRAQI